MAKLVHDQESNVWRLNQTIASAEGIVQTLDTENVFIDKDIVVTTSVPAAGTMGLSITDSTTDVTVGTLDNESGKYPLTASLSGTVAPATDGWASGNSNVSDTSVQVGMIAGSTMSNGASEVDSGDTINPAASAQTINISAGYSAARTIVIGAASAGPAGVLGTSSVDPGAGYTAPSTADVIVPSGGYLTLTSGYYPNTKIPLADIVPDSSNITVQSASSTMLQGTTAYDSDGVLVTGGIPTYAGDYTTSTPST